VPGGTNSELIRYVGPKSPKSICSFGDAGEQPVAITAGRADHRDADEQAEHVQPDEALGDVPARPCVRTPPESGAGT
jgi:hypothetical protein